MAKVCLIANVGQRDLQLDGCPLPSNQMRDQAAAFMAEFDAYRPRLSMPMLAAALERVQSDSGADRVDSLILAATDQTDEQFRPGDTLPAAEVLKKLLEHLKKKPACVVLAPIRDAPNSYDRMLDVYRCEVVARKQVKDAEKIYVLCTGGTPACNTALLLTSVEKYRERVTALYVSEKTGICTLLQVGDVLLNGYRRAARDQALAQYDFSAIAKNDAHPELARDVARAACARANFDFDGAEKILAGRNADLEKLDLNLAQQLLKETNSLRHEDAPSLLRDLFWNARIHWLREEYADFLGRVWRLLEMAYQLLLREATGIRIDGSPETENSLIEWTSAQPWLKEKLTNERIEPRQNMVAMKAMLEAICKREDAFAPGLRERIKAVLLCATKLQSARELRNKSIIAHGFEGLSQQVILEKLKQDEDGMWKTIEGVLAALSVDKGENPYEQFAALIRKADP